MDLMQIGLASQAQAFELANANYNRIVRGDELLADVHFEAEMRNCCVWANPKTRKTLICRNRPNEDFIKVHVKRGQAQEVFQLRDAP